MRLANTGTTLSGSQNFQTINNLNYGLDYSSAAWDIRQNFTTGFTYDLPFGRGRQFGASMNKAADLLLGGWQVNGILTLHTGQPYTVSASGSYCIGVWAGCFPDIVSGSANAAPAGGRTPSEWFNTANFTAPAALTQGNVGDNTNYGPPLRNLDASRYSKASRLRSVTTCNSGRRFSTSPIRRNSAIPDSDYGDASFGKVTSTLAGNRAAHSVLAEIPVLTAQRNPLPYGRRSVGSAVR